MTNRARFESALLARGEYDPERRVLRLEFNAGTIYEYFLVPQSVFDELKNAESPGTFFREEVVDRFPSRRIK